MSLINEMLRDLEKQRKQNEAEVTSSEAPVVVAKARPVKTLLLVIAGVAIATAIWFGIQSAPEGKLEKVVNKEIETSVTNALAIIPSVVPKSVAITGKTSLLALKAVETDNHATIRLSFDKFPEYQLLPNGSASAQLVISFSDTLLGSDFSIPELSGAILQRISLLPQKDILQLLVDMDSDAKVESFKLVDLAASGYQLLIDIDIPVTTVPELLIVDPFVAVIPENSPKRETAPVVVAELSKNTNRPNPYKQLLKQGVFALENGKNEIAKGHFSSALQLEPLLLDARLHLANLLLRQQHVDQGKEVLRQGLVLQPANPLLRKTLARLLLQQQQFLAAIDILQTKPVPAINVDLEYHALLAALQQESGQFGAASRTYDLLLKVKPDAAIWWFGMALTLDQSGKYVEAGKAYRTAMALPNLEDRLRNYSAQRLQQL